MNKPDHYTFCCYLDFLHEGELVLYQTHMFKGKCIQFSNVKKDLPVPKCKICSQLAVYKNGQYLYFKQDNEIVTVDLVTTLTLLL